MERIKKALEKAELQRQNVIGQQSKAEFSAESTEKQKIEYSQTRNVEISDDLLKQNRIIAGFENDPRSDRYKILRTKVLQKMRAKNWNLLAITSATRGAGKSLTAVNLAISIAQDANYSVLLADLDLRRPSVHEYFGLSAEPGLSDYFAGEKTISELLVHPGQEQMVFLPAGHSVQRSSDLLSTPRMLELASELKQRYPDRIVIVDLPPLLQTDDAMIFMPNVDACLLVVAEGENNTEEVQNSIKLIDQDKYLGAILNKSMQVDKASEGY